MKDLELVFYSEEFDEIAIVTNFPWSGVSANFSEEFTATFQEKMSTGIGFVFMTDWIFLGTLQTTEF